MLPSKVELKASCLCASFNFNVQVEVSAIPLMAGFCHCYSCRHGTGGLYSSNMPWPGSADEILMPRQLSLSEYAFSKTTTILFCAHCSSPLFCRETKGQSTTYDVFTGVLSDDGPRDMIRFKDHIFVGDTGDGGAALWLTQDGTGSQVSVPCYAGWRHNSALVDLSQVFQERTRHLSTQMKIPVHCHCNGISLVLRFDHVDIPHQGKLKALFDTRRSTRQFTGVDVMNWVVVPTGLIELAESDSNSQGACSGPPVLISRDYLRECALQATKSKGLSTLRAYSTIGKAEYYFCCRCSSSVFLLDDGELGVVKLAAGLINSPTGARAENILEWNRGAISGHGDDWKGWREGLTRSADMEIPQPRTMNRES